MTSLAPVMRFGGLLLLTVLPCHGFRALTKSSAETIEALNASAESADSERCPAIAGKYAALGRNATVSAQYTFEQDGCHIVSTDARSGVKISYVIKPGLDTFLWTVSGQRVCRIRQNSWPFTSCGDLQQCPDISGEYTFGDKTVTLTQDFCSGLLTPSDGSRSARFELFNRKGSFMFGYIVRFYYGDGTGACTEDNGGFEHCENEGGELEGMIGLAQTLDGRLVQSPSDSRPVFNIRFGPVRWEKWNRFPKGNMVPVGATRVRQVCTGRDPANEAGDCICGMRFRRKSICSQENHGNDDTNRRNGPYGCPFYDDDKSNPDRLFLYKWDCFDCECVEPSCRGQCCTSGFLLESTINPLSLPIKLDRRCCSWRSRKDECKHIDYNIPKRWCYFCDGDGKAGGSEGNSSLAGVNMAVSDK